MDARYLRHAAFQRLTRLGAFFRRRRMDALLRTVRPSRDDRILDLGGTPSIWRHVPVPLDVTLLNLPGQLPRAEAGHHAFTYVEGDACRADRFPDQSFDLVFSNSVIEHVGPAEKQEQFAREVLRLGRSYWIQTPSRWFPLEAHCGMPGWWFYPPSLREALLRRWRRKLPAWTEMVESTRVLSIARLRELFPGCRIRVEYACGFPKSYVAYRVRPRGEAAR